MARARLNLLIARSKVEARELDDLETLGPGVEERMRLETAAEYYPGRAADANDAPRLAVLKDGHVPMCARGGVGGC